MNGYECVIGLETHIALRTRTKLLCACACDASALPNTHVCPVCAGLPGAMPSLNRQAVLYAAMTGLALHMRVSPRSRMARKAYVYPDLPKAYQVTQSEHPLCEDGYLDIYGIAKRVRIKRLHIEEDAGKLTHDKTLGTLIDCNRCGVPLMEIVTLPDIRSAEEAEAYLRALHALVVSLGVSNGRMNEGSLRCDVNVSVRKAGDQALRTRTEIKNLNSFRSVRRAIEAECARQQSILESGGRVEQTTLRYDDKTGGVRPMREKEDADDYRYMPEPDIPDILLTSDDIRALRESLPQKECAKEAQLTEKYGLSPYAASQLVAHGAADAFEAAVACGAGARTLLSLMQTEVFRLMTPGGGIPLPPERLAQLCGMLDAGDINGGTAKLLLTRIWQKDEHPRDIALRESLLQINDDARLQELINEALNTNPQLLAAYLRGKEAAAKALMGAAMARSRGRANPERLGALLQEALDARKKTE